MVPFVPGIEWEIPGGYQVRHFHSPSPQRVYVMDRPLVPSRFACVAGGVFSGGTTTRRWCMSRMLALVGRAYALSEGDEGRSA